LAKQERPVRRFFLGCTIGLIAALGAGSTAFGQALGDNPARPPVLGNNPGREALSNPPIQTPPANDPRDGDRGDRNRRDRNHGDHRGHHHHHHGNGPVFLWPPIILPWPGDVAYIPGYPGDYFGVPNYYVPNWNAYSSLPQPAVTPGRQAPAPADPVDGLDALRAKIRTTNAEVKARAGKFIGYGDANFLKQNYLSAAERYKEASRIAPDLADSFLRQGFAFVAMGNYQSAAREFRRGLVIRSDWRNSGFRLDQIYGGDPAVKTAHLEALAKAVEANPIDSDLLALMGLMLFFDGQAERSETFFAGAAQQGGNGDHLLDHFLRQPAPAGAPRPDGPAKPGGKLVF
jgi:hypothetical protein